jgi:hypothetical protein
MSTHSQTSPKFAPGMRVHGPKERTIVHLGGHRRGSQLERVDRNGKSVYVWGPSLEMA